MWLNLKDIIEIPGAELGFDCVLDPDSLAFPALVRFTAQPRSHGRVVNTAGVLTLLGELEARMICRCDRCGGEFPLEKRLELKVPLSADAAEDDGEVFPLEGDGVDLDSVLSACFILGMDSKLLCSDDCKGLCPLCGKNLNEGSCRCAESVDPRWAVLGQLLDMEDGK